MAHILPSSYFESDDAVALARSLLGKALFSVKEVNGELVIVGGMITETEAYDARTDDSCHAYGRAPSPRTEVMFGPPGQAYVYLTYGMHWLLNLVVGPLGVAACVLVRGMLPLWGVETIQDRRAGKRSENLGSLQNLANGPGKVGQALGLEKGWNASSLQGPHLYVAEVGVEVNAAAIACSPRIGLNAKMFAKDWPWRFVVKAEHLKGLREAVDIGEAALLGEMKQGV